MNPVTLYDENHVRVGETYPRRAKQLVRSGRAVWLDEGKTLQTRATGASSSANAERPAIPLGLVKKENESMETFNNDGATVTSDLAEDMLMKQARKNVTERRSLIKHTFGIFAAVFGGSFVYFAILQNFIRIESTMHWRMRSHIHELEWILSDIPVQYAHLEYAHRLNDTIWRMREFTLNAHVPYLWVFMMGAISAWGVWNLVRIVKYVRKNVNFTFRRKPSVKPDAVMREYLRLKNLAEEM